jgi:glutathione S-transferase
MSSQLKPIKLWGRTGINPSKVKLILEELNLPYEAVSQPLATVKNSDYVAINPNGRVPSIHDPNPDITLWESGAIIDYLISTYDKKNVISFPVGTKESFLTKQWLFYQTSGQGPYYGQASWFKIFHHEKLPSALERYIKETNRVTAVLEAHLAQEKKENGGSGDGPWLVGNKCTYADAAFVPWQVAFGIVFKKEDGYDVDDLPVCEGMAWQDGGEGEVGADSCDSEVGIG